jgi:hypothetical protein
VAINGRPTFLVGQMDAEFVIGRKMEDVAQILEVMMVPFGMNLVKGDLGLINWTAWNNLVNFRRGIEKAICPYRYAWKRTGGGETTFGGPRLDLDQFDPEYFDTLIQHVKMANEHGIVPLVEIFSEHAINAPLHWRGHPFHPDNNVHDLGLPPDRAIPEYFENERALKYQETYVCKLLDVLKDSHYILAPFGEMRAVPRAYINRWLRVFQEHQGKTGRHILVCISGDAELLDTFAPDPAVDLIDIFCYHGGNYDNKDVNVPDGEQGIRQTIKRAWDKYHKPVGKLYHKYGYPYTNTESFWAQEAVKNDDNPPKTAGRDALWAVYESGGFGIFFKMTWARDRGHHMRPDVWSQDIRAFWEARAAAKEAGRSQTRPDKGPQDGLRPP